MAPDLFGIARKSYLDTATLGDRRKLSRATADRAETSAQTAKDQAKWDREDRPFRSNILQSLSKTSNMELSQLEKQVEQDELFEQANLTNTMIGTFAPQFSMALQSENPADAVNAISQSVLGIVDEEGQPLVDPSILPNIPQGASREVAIRSMESWLESFAPVGDRAMELLRQRGEAKDDTRASTLQTQKDDARTALEELKGTIRKSIETMKGANRLGTGGGTGDSKLYGEKLEDQAYSLLQQVGADIFESGEDAKGNPITNLRQGNPDIARLVNRAKKAIREGKVDAFIDEMDKQQNPWKDAPFYDIENKMTPEQAADYYMLADPKEKEQLDQYFSERDADDFLSKVLAIIEERSGKPRGKGSSVTGASSLDKKDQPILGARMGVPLGAIGYKKPQRTAAEALREQGAREALRKRPPIR